MAVLTAPVTISALAYDVLWEYVVGEPHHPALLCDSPGTSWTEREAFASTAMAELLAAGLAGPAGVHDVLLDTIALFNRPVRELYGWYSVGAATNGVLGVVCGSRAMVAHLACARLTLLPCTPGRLPDTIGDLLPEHSPIRGGALSVPAGELNPAGPARGDVDRARRMLSSARSGAGEFYAAQRDRLGRRHREEFPVCYADTAHGRFLTTTRRGPDRAVWLSLIPADRRAITERLRKIHNGQFR